MKPSTLLLAASIEANGFLTSTVPALICCIPKSYAVRSPSVIVDRDWLVGAKVDVGWPYIETSIGLWSKVSDLWAIGQGIS
jgi:hypothetical protein